MILEDEPLTAERLTSLLRRYSPAIEVLAVLDSVEKAIRWFEQSVRPDLIFADIHLNDGLGFELFAAVRSRTPVIFTTAHSHYSLEAFRVNSVDYLLKPIEFQALARALDKFHGLYPPAAAAPVGPPPAPPAFKQRFLVKIGQQLKHVTVGEVAYFHYQDEGVALTTRAGARLPVDYTLDQLESVLDPRQFFRISRKFLVGLEAVQKIHLYFNSRLKLDLLPPADAEVLVSRERVADFKLWLDA